MTWAADGATPPGLGSSRRSQRHGSMDITRNGVQAVAKSDGLQTRVAVATSGSRSADTTGIGRTGIWAATRYPAGDVAHELTGQAVSDTFPQG
jgi:hypothetical protein